MQIHSIRRKKSLTIKLPPYPSLLTVFFFVLAMALPAFMVPAYAQRVKDPETRKFTLAETYLRAGQYERAIALLEDLHLARPETYIYFDKLKQAYVAIKRYDDAIALVDRQLARNQTTSLMADKGILVYQKGEEEAAFSIWEEAIALAPDQELTYRTVYFALTQSRLFERAIALLEQGRLKLHNEALFRTDLAYLYGLVGEHEKSAQEYIALLAETPKQLALVKRRFSQFSAQDHAISATLQVVERAVRKDPLNRTLRELVAWLYLKAGDYPKAFNANRAIDRLEKENGSVLLLFARNAMHAEAYDVALQAYQEVLARYPDAPTAASAQFHLSRLQVRQARAFREKAFDAPGNRMPAPHYNAALEGFRGFVQNYPNDPRRPEALWEIGRLLWDVYFDLDAATAILQDVADQYPTEEASFKARFDLGIIALMRSDLLRARLQFSRLKKDLRIGELAEYAQFEMARIDFYTGQFESALSLVQALDDNTSTDIANDAIELKVLLHENKGPDSLNTPLRWYADAQYLQRQRRPQEALSRLDSLLTSHPQHKLNDEALFLRAILLRETGQLKPAILAFTEIQNLHPDSYLTDRSLFTIAEIYEQDLQEPAQALETYSALLVQYPGSLLAPEARTRIRALRGDGV